MFENGRIKTTNDERYATTFTITVVESCRCWEFDIENDNMKGHWTSVFAQKGKQTEIDFTESIVVTDF